MKKISFRNDILPMKDMLFRLAMRITLSREEAEDIVQDTLIKVWNRRDSWDTIESVEAFSLSTACDCTTTRTLRSTKRRHKEATTMPIRPRHHTNRPYNANV